jgi:putative transposase
LSSAVREELRVARRRIRELETELSVHRGAANLLKVRRLLRLAPPAAVGAGGAARLADRRDPRGVHAASYGSYGARRVEAELTLGCGIQVGHNAIVMLMRRAGIAGRTGSPKRRGLPGARTAEDLVDRMFVHERPNQLWLTDMTEHPTREGKVYRAVVLDAFSRRVVGWSVSHNPTAALTSNALGWRSTDAKLPAARQ